MTTFSDGLYQFGGVPVPIPMHALGKSWYVKPITGSNGNKGDKPTRALKTLAAAHAKAVYGDTVYLLAESNTASATTDYQSAVLTWSTDGVNLIGINCGARIGQRSRIAQLSTVKTIETLMNVTADNCLIANIEIFQGVTSSTATSPVALGVTGTRNHFYNCQISGNGDTGGSTDTAGARSLLLTGASENLFEKCYIGLDTVTRTTQEAEIQFLAGSTAVTRNIFESCIISSYAGAAGFLWLTAAAAAGDCDRFNTFKDCQFLNAIASAATTMTAGISVHASLGGMIILDDCPYVGASDMTAADSAKVKHIGFTNVSTTDIESIGRMQSVDVVA